MKLIVTAKISCAEFRATGSEKTEKAGIISDFFKKRHGR